jgi:hypothetical protein
LTLSIRRTFSSLLFWFFESPSRMPSSIRPQEPDECFYDGSLQTAQLGPASESGLLDSQLHQIIQATFSLRSTVQCNDIMHATGGDRTSARGYLFSIPFLRLPNKPGDYARQRNLQFIFSSCCGVLQVRLGIWTIPDGTVRPRLEVTIIATIQCEKYSHELLCSALRLRRHCRQRQDLMPPFLKRVERLERKHRFTFASLPSSRANPPG